MTPVLGSEPITHSVLIVTAGGCGRGWSMVADVLQ
jgi:hypothetical protein